MLKAILLSSVFVATVVSATTTVGFEAAVSSGKTETSAKASPLVAEKSSRERPRLPTYFSRVVDGQQRDKIYQIQTDYQSQISELESRLQDLVAQRDRDIQAVLTPEQRKQIESLLNEARARRSNSQTKSKSASQ